LHLRDPEALARSLLPWLQARLPAAQDVSLPQTPHAPEVGASSETWFISPLIREAGKTRQEHWVLRIEPTGRQIYKDPSVERQYRVMTLLHETGAVPTPSAFWYEADTTILGSPFFLMQRVEGETLPSQYHSQGLLARSSPEARAAMWLSAVENMAKIHRVEDPRFEFLARPELGPTGLDQEIAYWFDYLQWTGAPVRPIQERTQRWLVDFAPATRSGGLAWGDARLGNIIFQDHACRAIIDWETASFGGAETDLGWWLFYDWHCSEGTGIPRLEGVGDREATLGAWEHFAGRKAQAMEWHEVFGTWRFSVIVDRARLVAERMGQPGAGPARSGEIIAGRLERLIAG
jgi:aminoglycoside phosphotransferase (APT) family kinase protein